MSTGKQQRILSSQTLWIYCNISIWFMEIGIYTKSARSGVWDKFLYTRIDSLVLGCQSWHLHSREQPACMSSSLFIAFCSNTASHFSLLSSPLVHFLYVWTKDKQEQMLSMFVHLTCAWIEPAHLQIWGLAAWSGSQQIMGYWSCGILNIHAFYLHNSDVHWTRMRPYLTIMFPLTPTPMCSLNVGGVFEYIHL